MLVLLPDPELCQQALSLLERSGVESGLDLGVEGMEERAQCFAARVARAPRRRLGPLSQTRIALVILLSWTDLAPESSWSNGVGATEADAVAL